MGMIRHKRPHQIRILALVLVILAYAWPGLAQSRDLARFEKAKAQFRQGMVYFNKTQYLAAVEFFRKAIGEYPDYNTAREYLARSYRLAGFTDEALREWESLSGMASNNVLIQQKIDVLRLREGQRLYAGREGEFKLVDEVVSADMKRFRFTNPVDVAIDAEKNLYITSFSTGKLIKLDPNREGITVFSPGISSRLYGIDYYGKRLAVSDFQNDTVYIMNTEPRILKSFGKTGNGEGSFHGPQGVCYDRGGNIYVVDSGNHRVQKFSGSGDFILSFGSQGEYEGQFQKPVDCAASGGVVYVTDGGNRRIACFDDSGNFIKNISFEGIEKPRSISVHRNGLLVSDEKNGLLLYNPESERLVSMNSWEGGKGSFGRLYSALIDRDDFLYCLDYHRERLFVFSPLERAYTNFDVEISAVDAKKFPVLAFSLNVRDRSGRPLYGLTRDNFLVTEDGARIPGVYVDYLKNKESSVSMTLIVDRSPAMKEFANDIPWASEFILKKMRTNDALKIIGFNSDSWVENDFDWSRRRALRALRGGAYAEGKNLGKALYNGIADLLPKTNRRGLILITDGRTAENSFARYTERNVVDFARSHHVPVYIISFRERDPQLERIAEATGGALYLTRQVDELSRIYERVKKSEEYRYVLVYSTFKSPSLKGWWSDIKIQVSYKGQKGVEWGGYFVP